MFSQLIEPLLKGTGAPVLTDFFIGLILFALVSALILRKAGKWRQFTTYAPTLLTSLGILGTFAGIIVGLLEFDTDSKNIDSSIPLLLEGLKTAFISSLAGMTASILYRILITLPFMKERRSSFERSEIGAPELYSVMRAQVDGISAIHQTLGQESDGSVIGQIKLLRQDMVDNGRSTRRDIDRCTQELIQINAGVEHSTREFVIFTEKLWAELEGFAKMLSEAATTQVVEALKEVIRDFNANLTEQFGENFKHLNQAVEKLVQWQENYKSQLDAMAQQYELGVQAIVSTEKSVNSIEESALSIPVNMQKMQQTMILLQAQVADMDNHLKGMAEVRDKAAAMQPVLMKRLEEVVDVSTQSAEKMSSTLQASAVTLETSATNFQKQTEETYAQIDKTSKETFQRVSASVEEALKRNTEAMNLSFDNLDKAQQEHINRITGKMGGALVSITDKFTADYSDLVAKMDRIVRRFPGDDQ